MFSWNRVVPLLNFSKNLFFSGVINKIFMQLDIFIIGKIFMPATLGYYSRAKNLNQLIGTYSSGSLTTVLFPALSKLQNDIIQIKSKILRFYHLAALISFFLGGLLYLIAEDVIIILYTSKWLHTVPYFKIMVLSTFVYPTSSIIITPINSLGRTDIFLKLEILKKLVFLIAYIFGFKFGLMGFLYAMFAANIIGVTLNGYFAGELINWKIGSQWKVLLLYGIPSYICAWLLSIGIDKLNVESIILHLLISTLSFSGCILLFNTLLKTEGYIILKGFIKNDILKKLKHKK